MFEPGILANSQSATMFQYRSTQLGVVIGAGFAGLSAAATLAKNGYDVTLLEKNSSAGGRARMLKEKGFTFDMGPSWYWMPDVMERYFNSFGKTASDYFDLARLDPSYQIIFGKDDVMQMPANFEELKELFEQTEKGAATKLEKFLTEAEYKYRTGIVEFAYKPSVSFTEYIEWKLMKSAFRLDLFSSFSSHARKYFKSPKLLKAVEFPILFLGAMPSKTPALYSMMNYADMKLGTWYPRGGMHQLVNAMVRLAEENNVDIRLNEAVETLETKNGRVSAVKTQHCKWNPDVVVAGADYHHIETNLLEPECRTYSDEYWNKKTLAPSCLIYYVGVNKKLKKLLHHNLFFDEDFHRHAESIYTKMEWPENPLFYVCCPSVTDTTVAPEGMENLFILIPVAAGLNDTQYILDKYFKIVMKRLETFCGENISSDIVYKSSYAPSDFKSDYNAFKGNAYGLANTLRQTAFLRPSIRSRKVKNLFYAGQLTVPGPGVPPSIISGQLTANYIAKYIKAFR